MLARSLLGVATIAAVLTLATCQTKCHSDSYGAKEHTYARTRHAIVPAFSKHVSLAVPYECKMFTSGLRVSACYENNFTLMIASETEVNVKLDETPEEMVVKFEITCYEDLAGSDEPIKENVHNSPRHEHHDDTKQKDNPESNKASKDTDINERIKRSVKKQKQDEESNDENATPVEVVLENESSEKDDTEKPPKISKEERKRKKAEKKYLKSLKRKSQQEENLNKVLDNEQEEQQSLGKIKVKKTKKVTKDGKEKKVSKVSVEEKQEPESQDQNKKLEEEVKPKQKVKKTSKKVKFAKEKGDNVERRRRSAEYVDVELASSSTSSSEENPYATN